MVEIVTESHALTEEQVQSLTLLTGRNLSFLVKRLNTNGTINVDIIYRQDTYEEIKELVNQEIFNGAATIP